MNGTKLATSFALASFGLGLLTACPEDEAKDADNVSVEDLGSFTTDTGGEVDVPWTTPDGVVSTEVFCGPYGYGDNLATAAKITSPGGSVIYNWEDPYVTAMRVGTLDDMLPVLVSVSPDLAVEEGEYTMRLLMAVSNLPASVSCSVVNRIGDVADNNTVDVHVVFVGVDGIVAGMTAAGAESDDTMKSIVASLGDLWSDLGLELGEVSYEDFSGDVDTYTTVDGDEEFGNLLREASDGVHLTFFMVQDIEFGDGASILGLSGGPPGVATVGGTSKSGVVINVANAASNPDEVALIMAHEGGHFMGLFHPTEKSGEGHDPLGDTPECPDGNSDGTVSTSECSGKGAENVMWWAAKTGTSAEFSGDQAWVVARNPVVLPK